MTEAVAEILGVRRAANRLMDVARAIEKGLPARAIERVKQALSLSDQQMASLLGISAKTIGRTRVRGQRLSVIVGDRLFRAAHVFAMARSVLGGDEGGRQWLHTRQIGLANRVPLDLITTEAGAREVEDLLGRIEYGVLS